MILDDVKDCRSDIDDLRGEIESLRGERHLIDEILLANALQKIVRDEIDLEKDEKCVALAEYELGIQFPSPSGLSGCANQFLKFSQQATEDYMERAFFLEGQLYISRHSPNH
jgi:hypothetical protein